VTRPKTLADDPNEMRARLVHQDRISQLMGPLLATADVYAPCCGRVTAADSVIDLRMVPGTEFRAGNRRARMDHWWACCGCRWLLVNGEDSPWTHSKLARAIGASHEVVHELRARELRDEVVRKAHKEGRGIDPEAEYRRALASLPTGTVELEGTEPPKVTPLRG
jgi:hypothetical protein